MKVFNNEKDFYRFCLQKLLSYPQSDFEIFHFALKMYDKECWHAKRKKLPKPNLRVFIIKHAEFYVIGSFPRC